MENSNIGWKALQAQASTFSERLVLVLEELGIYEECKDLNIDHICVRLKDGADVSVLKKELEEVGQIISAVEVNGREIMIVQLNQALNLGVWKTHGIELPYPKINHKYKDGWEHVEFVLEAVNTMDGVRGAFTKKFPNLNMEILKSTYSYSEDVPHASGDQIPNPTIGLKVNGVGIKFHANSIQAVVGFEK